MTYQDWINYQSRLQKRDVSRDSEDYDLKSYFSELYANQAPGHLSDTHKRPNHPTFSNESAASVPVIRQGGEWSQSPEMEWLFTPSPLNVKSAGGLENLQRYFNEVETPEALNIPNKDKISRRKN